MPQQQKEELVMSDILNLTLERMATPIGELMIVTDDAGALRAVDWREYDERMKRLLRLHYGTRFRLVEASGESKPVQAMRRYFDGDLDIIDALPVATGGTPFQREVWTALRNIPCGETVSYGALARLLGRDAAVRAVGLANGANPIGIVVPCHRVVGANGHITGYAGGMERKRWLLAHERRAGASPELPLTG
jgi:methylated-DNA-[protein]-cysteine S-methyltransferase